MILPKVDLQPPVLTLLSRARAFSPRLTVLRWFARSRAALVVILILALALSFLLDELISMEPPQVDFTIDLSLRMIVFPAALALLFYILLRQRRAAAAAQAAAVEEERRRISREIHDLVAQQLGCLHLKLDALTHARAVVRNPVVRGELQTMVGITDEAYAQIYGLLSTLRPVASVSLADALHTRAAWTAHRTGIQLAFVTSGQAVPLAPESGQQVLYILGEALANVEKHAGAQHVYIRLAWSQDSLDVTVRDDGQGMPAGVAASGVPGHFGLAIMRERAAAIGGKLAVESSPHAGTSLTLSVPLRPIADRPRAGRSLPILRSHRGSS